LGADFAATLSLVATLTFSVSLAEDTGCKSGTTACPSLTDPCLTESKIFRVFDATNYREKPDLSSYRIEPIILIYESELFAEGSGGEASPTDLGVRNAAARAAKSGEMLILDVERWQELPDAAKRYLELIRRLRAASDKIIVGYYSVVPKRDYWRSKEGKDTGGYRAWQSENDRLHQIADEVDVLFPSLYTFYDYRPGWVAYAEENIREARRLAKGKPVYVFLWPTYSESNAQLKGQLIAGDFWRLQLETVRRLADGVVIWGGGPWDPDAEWWRETKRFMASLAPAPCPPTMISVE